MLKVFVEPEVQTNCFSWQVNSQDGTWRAKRTSDGKLVSRGDSEEVRAISELLNATVKDYLHREEIA